MKNVVVYIYTNTHNGQLYNFCREVNSEIHHHKPTSYRFKFKGNSRFTTMKYCGFQFFLYQVFFISVSYLKLCFSPKFILLLDQPLVTPLKYDVAPTLDDDCTFTWHFRSMQTIKKIKNKYFFPSTPCLLTSPERLFNLSHSPPLLLYPHIPFKFLNIFSRQLLAC